MNKFLDAVVITGAGHGLGKAVADKCADIDIPVLCISKSDNCQKTCEEIRKKGKIAYSIVSDIGDFNSTSEKILEWSLTTEYNRLGVVLAAGVLGKPGGIFTSNLSDWLETYKINLLGNLNVLQVLLPKMEKSNFGRIVFISGGGSAYAYPLFSGYACSKTALVREVENLEHELKSKGDIYCVCLAPGAMDTDMLQQVKQAGADIKTIVSISEPVNFILEFIQSTYCSFSGRFVHVRDSWQEELSPQSSTIRNDTWFLRRIEK